MMVKRAIFPLTLFVLSLLISFPNCSYSQEKRGIEERLDAIEKHIIRLEIKMEEGQKAVNQRIDGLETSLNKRIDDLHSFMNIMFGFIMATLIFVVGAIIGLYRRFSKLEGILEERKEVEIREVRLERQEREIGELKEIVKGLQAKIASS